MKTNHTSAFSTAAFVALLSIVPVSVPARESAPKDRATQLLTANGSISVAAANFFVERGSWQILVSTKLGWPSARLSDGTWLYHDFAVEHGPARGTLIVRFEKGRVSDLILATPEAVAALTTQKKDQDKVLVATRP